jgi:predicted nuclease of predicted toxin-antitoxin system
MMNFLIDENISPSVAKYLRDFLELDAIHIRDRGLLGISDESVLEFASKEDRILVTANVKDFEKLAKEEEIHAGMIFLLNAGLNKHQQIELVVSAIEVIRSMIQTEEYMINKVLYILLDGTFQIEDMP